MIKKKKITGINPPPFLNIQIGTKAEYYSIYKYNRFTLDYYYPSFILEIPHHSFFFLWLFGVFFLSFYHSIYLSLLPTFFLQIWIVQQILPELSIVRTVYGHFYRLNIIISMLLFFLFLKVKLLSLPPRFSPGIL